MPLRYSSETAEHHAVRTGAGLFDLSHMGEIIVSRPARPPRRSTTRWSASASTMARPGALHDDLQRGRRGPRRPHRLPARREEFLVVANAANAAVVAERAPRAGGRASTPGAPDQPGRLRADRASGPGRGEILGPLTDTDLDGVKYYTGYRATVAGCEVAAGPHRLHRRGRVRAVQPARRRTSVWQALAGAGAAPGLRPAGLAARDTLRLEAGMPLYGNELGPDRRRSTLTSAGSSGWTRRVISLAGTPSHRAETPTERILVGLRGGPPRPPPRISGPLQRAPRGTVTSGAPSPTLGIRSRWPTLSPRWPRRARTGRRTVGSRSTSGAGPSPPR